MVTATITVTLTIDAPGFTPEIREALDNLADVMFIQAEDGLYSDGCGRHGDGEFLADFARRTVAVSRTVGGA